MSIQEFLEFKNDEILDTYIKANLPDYISAKQFSSKDEDIKEYEAAKLYFKIQITKIINQMEDKIKAYGGEELEKLILTGDNIYSKSDSYLKVSDENNWINQKTINFGRSSEYYKINYAPFEYQYAQSLNRILTEGVECENRTGIDTLVVQHQYFHIKNISEHFPILRGKKLYPKMALKECIWMLMGKNDLKWLNDRKVTYWNEWEIKDEQTAERFNLDAEWIGTIGKSYGYQYRNFNGFDQVQALVSEMNTNPMGRRHIINLWNSSELNQMALPPCMYDFHFECTPVHRNLLNENDIYYQVDLHAHVRSNDSFLGAPYDFMFCGWMLNLICIYLNSIQSNNDGSSYFKPNDIHYTADNYHLYVNHIDAAKHYLANVDENMSGIIDVPSIIAPCFLDDFYHHFEKKLTIDEFLELVDTNMSKINIQLQAPKGIFEYGPIKADIAI